MPPGKLCALEAAREAGGTVTHHHGVGILTRRPLQHKRLGHALRVWHEAKTTWDPDGIMNPGRPFPVDPPDVTEAGLASSPEYSNFDCQFCCRHRESRSGRGLYTESQPRHV